MASLSFPLNCSEHRGSLGVEPRGGVRGSPVEMFCWSTHPQALGTLSRHSPSLAPSPLHAQTGKCQRGFKAASPEPCTETGEQKQGRGSSRGLGNLQNKGAHITHAHWPLPEPSGRVSLPAPSLAGLGLGILQELSHSERRGGHGS